MKTDLYQEVSNKIAAELERGAAPWVKPWASTPGLNTPCNAVSNRPYSGCNVVLLWIAMQENAWATPRFLTFKQAKEAGGTVRMGEKSKAQICFVKRLLVKDKKTQEEKMVTIPMMKSWAVFNVDQCDGLSDKIRGVAELVPQNLDQRCELADAFVQVTGADIREGAGEAYYNYGADFISLPAFAAFKSASGFQNTRFHELAHWTGHKSRLDRNLRNAFGTKDYAAEELTAELTAAFLCAEFSIDGELRHAGYIQTWAKLLRDDSKAFFTACSRAQKAADYLRGKALEEVAEAA